MVPDLVLFLPVSCFDLCICSLCPIYCQLQKDGIGGAAASAFHPARKKIQKFVDKTFFRLSYDYQQTILDFNDRAQKMISRRHLLNFFLLKLEKVLPLDHSGIILRNKHLSKATIALRGRKVDLRNSGWMKDSMNRILTKKGVLSLDNGVDFSFEQQLKKKGLEMVIPLVLSRSKISGFITLGKKCREKNTTGRIWNC